jgi:hypothetical protein
MTMHEVSRVTLLNSLSSWHIQLCLHSTATTLVPFYIYASFSLPIHNSFLCLLVQCRDWNGQVEAVWGLVEILLYLLEVCPKIGREDL